MRLAVMAGVIGAALISTTAAFGQAMAPAAAPPAPPSAGGTPEKMPFDIPYGQSIGAELAKKVLATAEGGAGSAAGR